MLGTKLSDLSENVISRDRWNKDFRDFRGLLSTLELLQINQRFLMAFATSPRRKHTKVALICVVQRDRLSPKLGGSKTMSTIIAIYLMTVFWGTFRARKETILRDHSVSFARRRLPDHELCQLLRRAGFSGRTNF